MAAISNEVGGRDGVVIAAALGGAVGNGVTTNEGTLHHISHREAYYDDDHDHYYANHHRHEHHRHECYRSRFCPSGQAKKRHC